MDLTKISLKSITAYTEIKMVKIANFILNSDFPALAQAFQKSHTVTSFTGMPVSDAKWREDYVDIIVPNASTIQRVNIQSHSLGLISPGYMQICHTDAVYNVFTRSVNANTIRLTVQCVQISGGNNTTHTESFTFHISGFYLP